MILNYIFSNLNLITLIIWIIFLLIVAIRFFQPSWVKNISYFKLILIAVGLNIFYGLFVSWGQYYTWSTLSDITRVFINSPLSSDVPFPSFLLWVRPLFGGDLGYFLYYILGRFWFNILITFILLGISYLIFKTWSLYRGGFSEYGPELLLILMLIARFPGMLVAISLGFILAILQITYFLLQGKKEIKIESVFIFTTLISLFFTNIILSFVL